jgi:5-(carboxyamino)imidazole ribonucleotide synthase
MKISSRPRIGILGAGQLALMLAEAGKTLDVDVICAGSEGDCAAQVAPLLVVDLENSAAVHDFAKQVDFVTIESENIDASVLDGLELYPNVKAIGIAQDRLLEKQFFQSCCIGVAPFAAVNSLDDLTHALKLTGAPAILKTRRGGYDGKGQFRLSSAGDAAAAWAEVGGVPCILEGMVTFESEVSLVAARNRDGEIAFYPLTENVHRDGILRTSVAPFAHTELQAQAEKYMRAVLEKLDYVGVLAIEFFAQGNTLLANEMAPRVHNSGHWTIEGSATSQFENCLRAMLGLELGSTDSQPTVMLNCIGTMPTEAETSLFPTLFRHDYGKEARPGRKVGHLTFSASESAAIAEWQGRLDQSN